MTEAKKRKNGKARKRVKSPPTPLVLIRFGRYLAERRKARKLTLRGLAKLSKTPHSNLFQFEKERKDPRLTELATLAGAFNERLDKFIRPVL